MSQTPTPPIQLPDSLYKEAQRQAAKAGFASVDEYVATIVTQDLQEENLDQLFTPERIAQLDQISTELKTGGKTYSLEQVQEHFEQKRDAWPQNHPR